MNKYPLSSKIAKHWKLTKENPFHVISWIYHHSLKFLVCIIKNNFYLFTPTGFFFVRRLVEAQIKLQKEK